MFEVPENIPEQIWTSSVSLFIFQLVQSSKVEQPLTTKTFLLPNLLPRIFFLHYTFSEMCCGVHEDSGGHTMGPGDSRLFRSSNLQGSRCWSQTSPVQNLSMQFSLALVLEGKAHPQWTKDGFGDISFQMFEGIIRICKIWNAKALRKHNRFISLLGGSGIPVKVWVETVGMLPVVGLRFFWMNFCGASPGVTATLVHPEATSGSSADYHTIKDQKNKRTKSTPSFKTW